MKKLIQLLEAKVKLNSSGCPNIEVDSDISLDLVNDALLSGICSAAKAAGVNVRITTAVSDHPIETNTGSISRHSTGNGVDISIINGKAVKDASNRPNVDNFVSKLEQLGYVEIVKEVIKNLYCGKWLTIITMFTFPIWKKPRLMMVQQRLAVLQGLTEQTR
jgi:hypothetical protein